MSDRGPLYDQAETPEDVATLYSWANLHGAKYRDFSESRAHTREQARLRMQQAMEAEQARAQQMVQAERDSEAVRMTEAARVEEDARRTEWAAQQAAQQAAHEAEEREVQEIARQAAVEASRRAAEQAALELAAREAALKAQEEAAQRAAEEAARQAAEMAAREAARQAEERAAVEAARHAEELAHQAAKDEATRREALEAAEKVQAAEVEQAAHQAEAPQVHEQRFIASAPEQDAESRHGSADYTSSQEQRPAANGAAQTAAQQEETMAQRSPWGQPDQRDNANRPAWLTPEHQEQPGGASVLPPPEDTLQGSRERLASRWYALRGLFEGVTAPPEPVPAAEPARPPAVAVFSLAGGVGKTSLAATLGRALSARGERILLVDTAVYGLMPFFFGAHDQRPGVLRTFSPPGTSGDAPVQMLTIDPETLGPEDGSPELLVSEISKYTRGIGRVIVDLPTASGATTRRILKLAPLVLVPMVPDMNSVVSVSSIDTFFERNNGETGKQPYYVLSQFDPSLPLHLDIREVLRELLGDRLLQVVLRRTPAMSEALAEGMTVMDYAPNSAVAEDFAALAGWVKSQAAPATAVYRGVRWSER